MDIIFSGVQPTGNLHIGNYLGAIKNFVEIQKRENIAKSYYCVVDLHAITVWQNPYQLKKDILETDIEVAGDIQQPAPKKGLTILQKLYRFFKRLMEWFIDLITE